VFESLIPLVEAQTASALGRSFLVVRDLKTGKVIRVSPDAAKMRLEKCEEAIVVWEKDPSTSAFTDLMNRAIDKPKEQEQDVRLTTDWDKLAARLVAARKRLAARTQE
jgi:hypothetical protein